MTALDPGVVELGVPGGRILELRIGGLAAERSESGNRLSIQSTGQVRRSGQSRDTVKILHAGATEVRRILATQDMREPQPDVKQRSRRGRPGETHRSCLLQGMNVTIVRATGRTGDVRLKKRGILAQVETDK